MKPLKSWRWLMRRRSPFSDGGKCGFKMRQLSFMGIACAVTLLAVYRITNYQYQQTEIDGELHRSSTIKGTHSTFKSLDGLPRGIIQPRSDLELRPLWSRSSSRLKVSGFSNCNLLAMPVGIKQKSNVNATVQKFLAENFTIILFHYDGNVDGWWDLDWSNKAIHIVAQNQTKWWFAKRFLHPDVVSIYDYVFLWDEDLGVKHFNPGRYLAIVKKEGLEISQPALDPNSTDIHHRITIRARTKKFHRRVYDRRGSVKCSDSSEGPPCTGSEEYRVPNGLSSDNSLLHDVRIVIEHLDLSHLGSSLDNMEKDDPISELSGLRFVEGMAPVFSRSAWHCTWHLIQNDLVHGWGMDMKLGYCAQGDRTRNVGVVDSEYVVHEGIQSLGGSRPAAKKVSRPEELTRRHGAPAFDVRTEIRRQSTWELQVFKERWNQAVEEDRKWVDPFKKEKIHRKRKGTLRA